MDTLNPWLLLIAGLVVGALLGGLVILLMERRSRGNDHDIRVVRRQLDDYRQEVAGHYAETARRVNELTHAYKSVYDHLEDGAYRLVGEDELRRRLDDRPTEPVMLEGIGQRTLHGPVEERDRARGRRVAADAGTTVAGAGAPVAGAGAGAAATAAEGRPRPTDPGSRGDADRSPAGSGAAALDADADAVGAYPEVPRPRGGRSVGGAADPTADEAASPSAGGSDGGATGDDVAEGGPDADAEDEARRT